ncbi:hypothetical protein AA313_de0210391 [Arthrobotrys entomopaga]|nr:hypothetical protein AA313_de0210391 [Arthrobotrys entomopaga]
MKASTASIIFSALALTATATNYPENHQGGSGCPATYDANCQFWCENQNNYGAGQCSNVRLTVEGTRCRRCHNHNQGPNGNGNYNGNGGYNNGQPTGTLGACPATYQADCLWYCNYPGTGRPGKCSNINITNDGAQCQQCPSQPGQPPFTIGGPYPPTNTLRSCPATYNPNCLYYCEQPGNPNSGTCSNVNNNNNGQQCQQCPQNPNGAGSCPATYDQNCQFFCTYPGQNKPGQCSNVNLQSQGQQGVTCQQCPETGATSCPAAYDQNCQFFCTWPGQNRPGQCSNANLQAQGQQGVTCQQCQTNPNNNGGYNGNNGANNCPATYNQNCQFFCNYPGQQNKPGQCSNVNLQAQGQQGVTCQQCVNPATLTSCPATYNAGCLWYCQYPGTNTPSACSNNNITNNGAKCQQCPTAPGTPGNNGNPNNGNNGSCPATYNQNCQWFCNYPGQNKPGQCSNVNITTGGARCTECTNNPSGTNVPIFTAGGSAIKAGSGAAAGFVALFIAAM